MLYFAYGSNMDPERMRERGVNFLTRQKATLKGWRLVFNKMAYNNRNEGYANIEQDKGGIVEGCLYEIPDEEIEYLDRKEGYPTHYGRISVSVEKDDKEAVEAITYIAQQEWISEQVKPSKGYLKHLLKAEDMLSEEYLNRLKNTETLD